MVRSFAGLLPFVACAAVWAAVAGHTGAWRRALLFATPLCGIVLMVGTEALSVVGQLRPLPLSVLWLVVGGTAAAAAVRRPPPWRQLWESRPIVGAAVGGWLAFEGILLSIVAFVSPPNNFDSLTYHMSRVANWAANGSVAPYATEIPRQLFSAPLAEFAIAHTAIISGDDRFANAIQLLATAVTVILMTLVAANLGLDRRGQVYTALVAATLPMAVAQATTTQNDAVLTMWVVCVVAIVTDRSPALTRNWQMIAIGASVALAVATKGTAFFFVPPFVAWFLFAQLRRQPVVAARFVAVCAAALLFVNAGVWGRNIDTFGTPLAPADGHIRPEMSVATFAETSVRDLGLQLGVPLGPRVNEKIAGALEAALKSLGLDANDPGSMPNEYRFVVQFGNREDTAGNLAHTVLLAMSLGVLGLRRRLRPYAGYIAACAGGFVLIALLARWSPYGNRYLLTTFVLLSPIIVAGLLQLASPLVWVALAGLCLSASFWLLASDLRPLVGPRSVLTTPRSEQYFAGQPHLYEPYRAVAEALRSERAPVGLVQGHNSWDYPLWKLLDFAEGDGSLRSVHVTNDTRRFERPTPQKVICTVPCGPPSGEEWSKITFDSVTLWSRTSPG